MNGVELFVYINVCNLINMQIVGRVMMAECGNAMTRTPSPFNLINCHEMRIKKGIRRREICIPFSSVDR